MLPFNQLKRAALTGLMVALAGPLLSAQLHTDVSPDETSKTAELFRSSCSSCHLPPDPAFATDRAWLNQIKDTA